MNFERKIAVLQALLEHAGEEAGKLASWAKILDGTSASYPKGFSKEAVDWVFSELMGLRRSIAQAMKTATPEEEALFQVPSTADDERLAKWLVEQLGKPTFMNSTVLRRILQSRRRLTEIFSDGMAEILDGLRQSVADILDTSEPISGASDR